MRGNAFSLNQPISSERSLEAAKENRTIFFGLSSSLDENAPLARFSPLLFLNEIIARDDGSCHKGNANYSPLPERLFPENVNEKPLFPETDE